MPKCVICGVDTPLVEFHHIIPQFIGGGAGPIVPLCSNDHSAIHKQALNIMSKKAKKTMFLPPSLMERAKPLVGALIIAIQQAKENPDIRKKMKIIMEVDANLLTLLHICKVDAGFTNLSIFCANILRDYVTKKLL